MRNAPESAWADRGGAAFALTAIAATKARRAAVDNLMAGFACPLLLKYPGYARSSPKNTRVLMPEIK
jgi:hypothetical protein